MSTSAVICGICSNMCFPPRRPIRPEASDANINIARCPNKWTFVFVISQCRNSGVTSSLNVYTNSLPSPVEFRTSMIRVCLEFWGRFSWLNVVSDELKCSNPENFDSFQIKIRFLTPHLYDSHDVPGVLLVFFMLCILMNIRIDMGLIWDTAVLIHKASFLTHLLCPSRRDARQISGTKQTSWYSFNICCSTGRPHLMTVGCFMLEGSSLLLTLEAFRLFYHLAEVMRGK